MGFGLFWKEAGPSSSEQLASIKKDLGLKGASRKGIGHAGTLDPFAEGWLLVAWDEGTKLLSGLGDLTKTYEAEMLLGLSSETFDTDTQSIEPYVFETLKEADLEKYLASKVGRFFQVPPRFSAKKIAGQTAYDLARKGADFELKSVERELLKATHLSLSSSYSLSSLEEHVFSPTSVQKWKFLVKVSSGTYIRAFARDWAFDLTGQASLLMSLKRVGIGSFFEDADKSPKIFKDIEDLAAYFEVEPQLFVERQMPLPPLNFSPQSERGRLLLDNDKNIKAVWNTQGERWRYFANSPLKDPRETDSLATKF